MAKPAPTSAPDTTAKAADSDDDPTIPCPACSTPVALEDVDDDVLNVVGKRLKANGGKVDDRTVEQVIADRRARRGDVSAMEQANARKLAARGGAR